MATRHRRTKRKDWNDSSDDTDDISKDDDGNIPKKFKRISYVQREKLKEQKKTKKVLSKLCDSEESSSDMEQKKQKFSRPMQSLPLIATKQKTTKNTCISENSSSDSSSGDKELKSLKDNVNSKKQININKNIPSKSESDSKKSCTNKKQTIKLNESKLISNKKKKLANNQSISKRQSDSDSSKEFEDLKKKNMIKKKHSFGYLQDCSYVDTPSKSDDEAIPVEKKDEISLKHYVVQEVEIIEKNLEKFQEDLKITSNYLINKNIQVLRDSKYFAHKLLRTYDAAHEMLKDSRNKFADLYKVWLQNCSKKRNVSRSSTNQNLTNNLNQLNTSKSLSKKVSNVSNNQLDKPSLSSSQKRFTISSDDSEKDEDVILSQNKSLSKTALKVSDLKLSRMSASKSNKELRQSSNESSENEFIVKASQDCKKKLHYRKSLSTSEPILEVSNTKLDDSHRTLQDDDSPVQVSECDSDQIFSGDETRSSKKNRSINDNEEEKVSKLVITDSVGEIHEEKDPLGDTVTSPRTLNRSDSKSSEDLFESTISEIGNTPIKSPILSAGHMSLRKSMFLGNKTKNISVPMAANETSLEDIEESATEMATDASNVDNEKPKKFDTSIDRRNLSQKLKKSKNIKEQEKTEKSKEQEETEKSKEQEEMKMSNNHDNEQEEMEKSNDHDNEQEEMEKSNDHDNEQEEMEKSNNHDNEQEEMEKSKDHDNDQEEMEKSNDHDNEQEEMEKSNDHDNEQEEVEKLEDHDEEQKEMEKSKDDTSTTDEENDKKQEEMEKSADGDEEQEKVEKSKGHNEKQNKIEKTNKKRNSEETPKNIAGENNLKLSNEMAKINMNETQLSFSELPTPPINDIDSETEAFNRLISECTNSNSSVCSDTKKNDDDGDVTDADSEKSVNSTSSTIITGTLNTNKKKKVQMKKFEKKMKRTRNEEADTSNKSMHKTNRLSLTKTKSKLVIYSGSPSSSSSSSSDSGAVEKHVKKKCLNENSSDDEASQLTSTSSKRLAINLRKNRYFKADQKLRMQCRVVLERLSNNVLKKHAKALDKSKKYVANKKLKSITNLDGLEGSKKRFTRKALVDVVETSEASETSNGKEKKKKINKREKKSVKDHLDNSSNEIGSDENMSDRLNDTENNKAAAALTGDVVENDVVMEAEIKAKEALLKSNSSSSDDKESDMEVKEHDSKKQKKIKSKSKEVLAVEMSDDKSENGKSEDESNKSNESVDKKDKSAWKNDEILSYQVMDTESEEEKFKKSQEKKKTKELKEKEEKTDNDEKNDEVTIVEVSPIKSSEKNKRTTRKKRRILDSDSDAKLNSSDEDSDEQIESDEEEEEKEEKEEKKKKGRKRRQKSSGSDSSSSDKKPKSKRRRIKKVATDSESDDQDSPNKGRKNIRKVLKDKHVADDTKKAAQDEEERLKRIAERQKLFNEMYDARLAGEAKVDKLVLDFDEETKKELVIVNEELVKRLKPHQAKGIKFMWDACFESLKQIEKSEGSGCIIAHCMGLGKTFQVVTLAHTLLTHEETGVKTVMVVCPLSTVLNWVNEFKTWLKHVKDGDEIEIYELTKMKKNIERKYQLESWQKTGGVLIIGYEMFRNLTSTGKKMRKAMQESIMRSLVDPGADLVVCDEGHLLKNEESALSKAMKLVKTLRRIVLTGTPLQNNLKEYHCMVQFVKPNLLGTKKEFLNRFVNPITNGQFDDSTPYDVKLMKKRAHVLHKMLEGSVQRFDYSVLTPFLPPKQEYVIFVRLTDVQIKMYQHYLDNFARRFGQKNGSLFADFQELQRIWTHPYVLRLNAEKVEKANEKKRLEASDSEGSLKDFIDDASDTDVSSISLASSGSNSDIECLDSDKEKPTVKTRSTRLNPKEEPVEEVPIQESVEEAAWWSKFVEEEHFGDLRISTKLTLLFGILKESEQIGDKVLVFSQSLYSLTLIEHFLNLIDTETQNGVEAEHLDKHNGTWGLGLDYFRLDGSTSAENRSAWCKIFNNPKNTRARLFLISTRAGGLGINLTAANRVIIFDASWNPSHDVQSIFRIYRFGQKKPCYVYRFLAAGTMEEKIYNRQVTKLSLACRVVDEQQIERHYSNNDLAELYQFDSYEGKSVTLNLPKDRLLAEIFLKYKDAVYNYHEHDSLLENKEEEELDEEERKQAWLEYEEEKQGKRQVMNVGNNMGFNPLLMNMNSFPELESIKLLIQKDYPNLPPEHLDSVARQAVFDMYRFVDQQAVSQLFNNPFAATQNMPQQNMMAPPMNIQQQQIHQQNQLMNMLSQPQMNYPGVNQMPVYSGRGRPPKHLSMNPMANLGRQMPMPVQPQQTPTPVMRNNDEVEILNNDQQVTQPNIDPASNINNIQKE